MSLSRRLDTWLREGIIDADTAERIAAFEESRSRLQEAAARNVARAVIVINPNGTPILVDLEVDGAPLSESRSR